MADFDLGALIDVIRTRYGANLLAILGKPGVWDVVNRALTEGPDAWNAGRLELALHDTDYYKNTPIEQRQWDALTFTDPATANEQGNKAARMVQDTANQLGLQLSGADAFNFAAQAAIGQWDANRTRYELLNSNTPTAGPDFNKTGGGREVAQTAAQIKGLADSYGVPSSDENTMQWARQVAAGTMTLDAVRGSLQQWAGGLYPILKPHLDAGLTVADFAAPYMQAAAQELGINANAIRMADPKWTSLFINQDDKGNQTIRSLQDSVKVLRTDPQYGYDQSQGAVRQAATFASSIRQMFGFQGAT